MILFVAGAAGDPGAGRRALRGLLERLPFFPGETVETWRAPSGGAWVAWVAHGPERTGGAAYVAAGPERIALFAGRPILWAGERRADGRAPLDPTAYLDGIPAELDGRFAALRAGGHGLLELRSDPLGAYPVYEAHVEGVRWVSNNPELLRDAHGSDELDPDALAGLVGGGWSLDGHPVWAGVRRILPAATAVRPGGGLDPDRAAALLTAGTRALADWPGRPSVVPVTGGRDSRLVLAAALAAGIEFEANTGGDESAPDVRIGRTLAEVAGVPHSLIGGDSMWQDWRRGAELVAAMAAGTATLADAAGFPLAARPGPLPLWHSGQGGEIARAYYGLGDGLDRDGLADRLTRAFLARRPGRAGVLSADGRALVHRRIAAWVDEQLGAGIAPVDVPDMFYLRKRMGTWAGPGHGCVEYVRDTTSPLWSARLLPDLLGAPAAERARYAFHRAVLERLSAELAAVPFEGGGGWPRRGGELARRVERGRTLARKALAEARRRAVTARRRRSAAGTGAPGTDPFDAILPEIRDTVLSQPNHPAWPILDRARVEKLLASDPAALDAMSRYHAWRLATVFAGLPPAGR
ncbi:MAG TPA: hypothetical protein VF545_00970 [Thermoleophilaceae bacterium]